MDNMVMNMNDMKDLKDVLEKVEKKIMAAGKIYGAMNFAFWLIAMLGYYVLAPITSYSIYFTIIYWPIAFATGIFFIIKITRMIAKVERNGSSRGFGAMIGISWGIGAALGWFLIPSLNLGVNTESSMAIGFLSFMSISIFGMWLSFIKYKIGAEEMIPAFSIPAIGIPMAMTIKIDAMAWSGFVVAISFSITILWYLYSAFKYMGVPNDEGHNQE